MAATHTSRSAPRDIALILLLFVLIVVGATAVRFYNLGGQSLWSDEGNSAALATRSLAQIARDAAHDIHPPLYYWLLHLWTRVAGTSEAGLRSFSALTGVLLALTAGAVGRRLFDLATGLVTAFIMALAPFAVYYSQEARMYILVAFEATLAVLAFWWFVNREDAWLCANAQTPRRYMRLLPLSGQLTVLIWTAGLYTHYAFPLIIVLLTVLYLCWLIASWRRGYIGRRLLRWALLLALTMGLFAPWLEIALRQITTWPTGGVPTDLRVALPTSLAILGFGPVARNQIGEWWIWTLPTLAFIGVLSWPRGRHLGGLRWAIPIVWVVAPLAMMLAFGLYRDAYLKFLLIASPAYSLLLARGVLALAGGLRVGPQTAPATPPKPAREAEGDLAPPSASAQQQTQRVGWGWLQGVLSAGWVVAAMTLIGVLSAVTLVRYFTDPAVARDDYRGIAQFIVATAHPGDAILLNAPGQSEVFDYYYRGTLPIYPLPRQRPIDPDATLAELSQLLDYEKIYAIYWATVEADPGRLIETWMNNRGYKTLEQWRGNVRLTVYVMPERRSPDETKEAVNIRFGEDIMLLGYRGWNLSPNAGQVTQLQLLWWAERKPAQRYKVFLQLLDPRDQVIAQRDSEPVGDSRPTNTWDAGELVLDNHGLLIPPGTPPGTYRRIIGLYDRETGVRLRLPDGKDHLSLPPVTVARAVVPPPLAGLNMMYTQSFGFGNITLLGHDRYKRGFRHIPETPLYPGDRLHLTFYWQATVQPRADWRFDLTLNDASGYIVARLEAPLVGETYATTLWQKGEIVRGEHDLQLPADLRPGTYRLSVVLLPDTDTQAGATAYLGTVEVKKQKG